MLPSESRIHGLLGFIVAFISPHVVSQGDAGYKVSNPMDAEVDESRPLHVLNDSTINGVINLINTPSNLLYVCCFSRESLIVEVMPQFLDVY